MVKLSHEQFCEKFEKVYGNNEYSVIGVYTKSSEKIEIRHNSTDCNNYIFRVTPNQLLSKKTGCPKCSIKLCGQHQKISYSDIKNYIEIESNSGCKIISKEYVGVFEKIKIMCKCGNTFHTPFKSFRDSNKRQCNECGKKLFTLSRSKTSEHFKQEVFECVGVEYSVNDSYVNCKTKVDFIHNICGYRFKMNSNSFLRGSRCPKCSGSIKNKTTDYFKEEIVELLGCDFEIVGEYAGAFNPIELRHKICDTKFERVAKNLFRNKNKIICPNCDKFQYAQIKNIIEMNNCELLTAEQNYKNSANKLTIKCYCGVEFKQNFATFQKGEHHGCPKCYHIKSQDRQRMKIEDVKTIIENAGCKWIEGEYKNLKSKLLLSCNSCSNTYITAMDKFIYQNKRRCNYCAKVKSKGECEIERILMKNNREFDYDKHMDGLDGFRKGKMRFDFIVRHKNKVVFIIEFDGIQHFTGWSYTDKKRMKKSLEEIQKNDLRKNLYCLKRKIPLIRIPYFELENIENIITNCLEYFDISPMMNMSHDSVHSFLVNHPNWSHDKYISRAV